MDTLVSIATPVYNTARFLPAALDSLLAQDHRHWEGLLWDDGSSDGSGEIAAEYARRDPRFRLLGNGRNNGVGVALSSALAQASGQYLCVLDSDDLLEADALSSMLAFMRRLPRLRACSRNISSLANAMAKRSPKRRSSPSFGARRTARGPIINCRPS